MDRLRLYWPCKPYWVNQQFGANLPCVKDFGLPTQSIVTGTDDKTCPAGYEKLYPRFGMNGHNGLDLAAGEQRVSASCAGTVVELQNIPSRGLGIGVLTDDLHDFGPLGAHYAKLRYWHLKEFYVKPGDRVEVGTALGLSDTTGYSSGNHLHFELNLMDKDAGGHPYQAFPSNGTAGAQDPQPYFAGSYAEDYMANVTLYQRLVAALSAMVIELKKKN